MKSMIQAIFGSRIACANGVIFCEGLALVLAMSLMWSIEDPTPLSNHQKWQ
jgi:hypothetical protein